MSGISILPDDEREVTLAELVGALAANHGDEVWGDAHSAGFEMCRAMTFAAGGRVPTYAEYLDWKASLALSAAPPAA